MYVVFDLALEGVCQEAFAVEEVRELEVLGIKILKLHPQRFHISHYGPPAQILVANSDVVWTESAIDALHNALNGEAKLFYMPVHRGGVCDGWNDFDCGFFIQKRLLTADSEVEVVDLVVESLLALLVHFFHLVLLSVYYM